MRTALIGYTGFVGSNLASSSAFDDVYNSRNIGEIRGKSYDLVVSAGNRADSFRINTDQASDLAEIDALAANLEAANISELVLVSTVCVYPSGSRPDEDTPLSAEGLTPYGQNRLHQEERLATFTRVLPVRLPQLIGSGIKKGIIYDLANDYRVEHIRPHGEFQYYDVRGLWRDIEVARSNGLESFNVATPPLTNAEVALTVFGRDISAQQPSEPESPFAARYTRDMTTKHAHLFGGADGYVMSRDQEIRILQEFADELRRS